MAGMHTGLVAVRSDAIDRWLQVGLASGRVINVAFPEERPPDATDDHPLADRLLEYLDGGTRDDFGDIEIALTVATDHRHVYETLREVEYGRSLTLEEFVGAVPLEGDDDDHAAVQEALRANPVPLIVPDHRISGADGATPPDVREVLRRIEGLD